jgi:hypothetical protein
MIKISRFIIYTLQLVFGLLNEKEDRINLCRIVTGATGRGHKMGVGMNGSILLQQLLK